MGDDAKRADRLARELVTANAANDALRESIGRLEHRVSVAEKERDDALKALGTIYVRSAYGKVGA